MIKKSVDFERESDVQAIVYSVNEGSAVFVVLKGFVVLEVPVSQVQEEYFKMYENSPKVFMLHGKAKFHYVCDCEVELIGFTLDTSELTTHLVNPNLFSHINFSSNDTCCIYDDIADTSGSSMNPSLYC